MNNPTHLLVQVSRGQQACMPYSFSALALQTLPEARRVAVLTVKLSHYLTSASALGSEDLALVELVPRRHGSARIRWKKVRIKFSLYSYAGFSHHDTAAIEAATATTRTILATTAQKTNTKDNSRGSSNKSNYNLIANQ
ncbi:hypothetical protein PoB_000122500 [Plakobranchus ocellatus]|uniref:Uncharacterized protein n=1 Tax=Plakobranchus ocellatus TaxID=259542 RepID=A0AAV3XV82_9GAST|nr:hypothetical protein PoB_000122500 [Plakobranchus ocellatus]